METKYIVTKKQGCIFSVLMEEGQAVQMDIEPERGGTASVGDVFVGKIKDIVPNIQAAFIEIANGEKCYLSLEDLKQPIYLNPKKNEIPHQGDELLVQVSKEAVKTKPADVTVNINITGRYAILTHGKTMIGISGKIRKEECKKHLRSLLKPYENQEYGFIVRTNAQYASDEELLLEIDHLVNEYRSIRNKAEHSTCFSCISRAEEHFISDLRTFRQGEDETGKKADGILESGKDMPDIITDDREIYDRIKTYLSAIQPKALDKLRFYEDSMISLENLYSLGAELEKAARKKVWLSCGGYLVIEPTEALFVIDVNSGKAVGKKKDKEKAYYKVNMEAAKEIARQIRLRNLSGIIVVDFIDMKDREHTDDLIRFFVKELEHDPIKTNFIDMTGLHLAEITRKKVRKPLHEQMYSFGV